jgi:chromosome segregation ATPase
MELQEQIAKVAAASKAKLKAPAKKKPAPSLTAQLKSTKAQLKATKEGFITALDNLQFAREELAKLEIYYKTLSTSQKTPQGLINTLSDYRSSMSVDDATDALILRLIHRLTNLC